MIASILVPIWAYQLGPHFEYAPVVKLTFADWVFYPVLSVSVPVMVTAIVVAQPATRCSTEPGKSLIRLFGFMTIACLLFFVAPFAIANTFGLRPFWVSVSRCLLTQPMFLWLWFRNSRLQNSKA